MNKLIIKITEDLKKNFYISPMEEKQLMDLENIYDVILDNYVNLNNLFGFSSPIEVYSFFQYLIQNGYLSLNKVFKAKDGKVFDFFINNHLSGLNIFNGAGVCRHTSRLLSDVFNRLGFEGDMVYCFSYTNFDDKIKKIVNKYIDSVYINGVMQTFTFKPFDIVINHVITKCEADYNYYFDPTNKTILVPKNKNNQVLTYKNKYNVLIPYNRNIYSDYDGFLFNLEYISKICEQNIDFLEGFYDNNSTFYEEINSKIKVLSKTKNYM